MKADPACKAIEITNEMLSEGVKALREMVPGEDADEEIVRHVFFRLAETAKLSSFPKAKTASRVASATLVI